MNLDEELNWSNEDLDEKEEYMLDEEEELKSRKESNGDDMSLDYAEMNAKLDKKFRHYWKEDEIIKSNKIDLFEF